LVKHDRFALFELIKKNKAQHNLLPLQSILKSLSAKAFIETVNLTKKFRNNPEPSVNGLNLTIEQNEIFGLLGPNGAGKTTTISMLCGLIQPSSGEVLINGENLHHHAEKLKAIIGIVPQDIALYPTLTARENLNFFGNMYGIHGKKLKEVREEWLEKLGLTDAANRQVGTYSGGMKRRVNLIAGILHQPKILFLDEPTVGVDVHSRTVIIEHLKEINKTGTTILYTSHHLQEAENFCTHIAIMDYGKIIMKGTPTELLANFKGGNTLEHLFLDLTDRNLRDS
jgi:ABC-2 type transport system ATP-binding protein